MSNSNPICQYFSKVDFSNPICSRAFIVGHVLVVSQLQTTKTTTIIPRITKTKKLKPKPKQQNQNQNQDKNNKNYHHHSQGHQNNKTKTKTTKPKPKQQKLPPLFPGSPLQCIVNNGVVVFSLWVASAATKSRSRQCSKKLLWIF